MLGRFRDSSPGCCRCTTSGIRASQVSLGIFLEIRRASGSDSVEIVCRSQIAVVVFVGSCVDLRRTQGVLKESLVE